MFTKDPTNSKVTHLKFILLMGTLYNILDRDSLNIILDKDSLNIILSKYILNINLGKYILNIIQCNISMASITTASTISRLTS